MVIQALVGNPYNGYINPYYRVDFPIPYYMEIPWELIDPIAHMTAKSIKWESFFWQLTGKVAPVKSKLPMRLDISGWYIDGRNPLTKNKESGILQITSKLLLVGG